jgi:hypothetical protein
MVQVEDHTPPNGTRWPKTLATCATVGIVVFVVLLFTPTWAILTTPSGRDIPRSAPHEDNRVYHPFGFSIIAPPNWRTRVWVGDDDSTSFPAAINMYPDGAIPRRYSASMGVSMDTRPKDLDDYTPTSFQGEPAYQCTSSRADGGFENPGHFNYDLAFDRENRWYIIRFHLCTERTRLPPEIKRYIDSFRIHDRPGAPTESDKKGRTKR